MAELNALVLNGSTGNAASGVLDTSRIDNLFLQITVSVSAATLQGSLTFNAGVTTPLLGIPSGLTLVAPNALPTGYTAPTTGGVLAIANPDVGTATLIYRVTSPLPLHSINYAYTSGGGTVSVLVYAYGWRHAT